MINIFKSNVNGIDVILYIESDSKLTDLTMLGIKNTIFGSNNLLKTTSIYEHINDTKFHEGLLTDIVSYSTWRNNERIQMEFSLKYIKN